MCDKIPTSVFIWTGNLISSQCYKTFLGENLDFPRIKKLNKSSSDVWTSTEMWKNAIFDHNYTYSKTVIAFKGPILAVLFL